MKFKREHWIKVKFDNENLIINNSIQIEMAKEIVKMCEKRILEFPVKVPKEEKQKTIKR